MKSTCWDKRATDLIVKSDQKDIEESILSRKLPSFAILCGKGGGGGGGGGGIKSQL